MAPMNEEDFLDLFGFRAANLLLCSAPSPDKALSAVQEIREMFAERDRATRGRYAVSESDGVFRAWMLGMNPHLEEENPLMEIIAGHEEMVLEAARAYVQGDWTPRIFDEEAGR